MKNILLASLLFFSSLISFAGPFTAGNIVVVRLGDGGTLTSAAGAAVFLDEFTTSGTLVQSVALPTAASGNNHILVNSSSATSEAALTLSGDGQYLVLCGYDAAVGTAAVATAGSINRTIARIGADGVPNTSTGIMVGGAYVTNNIRAGVTNDGTGFWTSGNSAATATAGVFYVPFGSFATTPTQISSTVTNTRTVNIFNGQLYVASGSGSFKGVNAVGTGLPTTTGQTIAALPGISSADTGTASPGSPYGFYFADLDNSTPGLDVVYICDDRTRGGLMKFSLVGSNWTYNGKDSSVIGVRGITGKASGGSVTLYVTTETGLYTLTDATGYNHTITSKLSSIATPGSNKKFRGIAFAPAASPCHLVASVSSVTNATCNGSSTGAINITTTGAAGTPTFNWGGGVTSQNRTDLAAGTYTVTVNDGPSCSDTASATITQPTQIVIIDTVTNLPCTGGTNGAVHIGVTGGSGVYTYAWNVVTATTKNIDNLSKDTTYTVTVTDNSTCTATLSAIVSKSGNLTAVDTVNAVKCNGQANGTISLGVTGGTPGYTFAWTGGSTNPDRTGLAKGDYSVTISDNGGCTLIKSYTVTEPDTITITATPTDATTHGATNGAVNITVTGGTPTYTYAWTGGVTNQNLTAVAAGTYCVTVTDHNLCTNAKCATVGQPSGIEEADWLQQFNVYVAGQTLYVNIALNGNLTGGLEMYDISGKYLYGQKIENLNSIQQAIPVNGFAPGYYLIRLNTPMGNVTKRVVITN